MKPLTRIKYLWYSHGSEFLKGAMKGQVVRATRSNDYKRLKKIRPNRQTLVRQKKELLKTVKAALEKEDLKAAKIFGRVKTMGSLDRKYRHYSRINPKELSAYMAEDLIGITIVVKSKGESYTALEALKKIGTFPKLENRENPRDYFNEPKTVRHTSVVLNDTITGNMSFKGVPMVHVMIFTKEAYQKSLLKRGQYKRDVFRAIRGKQSKKI